MKKWCDKWAQKNTRFQRKYRNSIIFVYAICYVIRSVVIIRAGVFLSLHFCWSPLQLMFRMHNTIKSSPYNVLVGQKRNDNVKTITLYNIKNRFSLFHQLIMRCMCVCVCVCVCAYRMAKHRLCIEMYANHTVAQTLLRSLSSSVCLYGFKRIMPFIS